MKNRILEVASRRLTSEQFDVRLGQYACWIFALLMLVVTVRKLATFELTESQLFFGILLAFVCPLLAVILGLLMPLSVNLKNR